MVVYSATVALSVSQQKLAACGTCYVKQQQRKQYNVAGAAYTYMPLFMGCAVQGAYTYRQDSGCMEEQLNAGLLCPQSTLHGTPAAAAAAAAAAALVAAGNHVVPAAVAAGVYQTADYLDYKGKRLAAQQQRCMGSTGCAR
jgi:hypothetical protein